MVNPGHVDISRIPQPIRLQILEKVLAKGVKPKALGITPSYLYKIRHGERKVSDKLLEKLLAYLSHDELMEILKPKGVPLKELLYSPNGKLDYITVARILKLIEEESRRDPLLKELVIETVRRWLEEARELLHSHVVKPEHIEKFKRIIKDKAKDTQDEYMRYLLKAMKDLNWELNPDKIQDYLLELREESEYVALKVSKALKKFIKEVIKDQVLYNSFKTMQVRARPKLEALTLEQVKAIAKHIEHPGAKAYFILLAETGLRPGEVLGLKLEQLDLANRMIRVFKPNETKRAYVSFFSKPTQEYLANEYLPFRRKFIERYEMALRNLGYPEKTIREWKHKLFPFKDYELRQEIYKASMKAIGRAIKLYELRAFFASYMSLKGLPGQVIDLLQGRVPPREFEVLQRHYLAISISQLRELYDKAGLVILS